MRFILCFTIFISTVFLFNLKNSTLIEKRYATFNYGISQIPELLKREKGTTICCLQTANDYIPNFEDEVYRRSNGTK